MNYKTIRDLLFLLPTELSHHLSLQSISLMQQMHLSSLLAREVVADPVQLMGLEFPNRVGLAAGLDKDANHIDGFAALGFGFIEVGTVTPRAQPGNAKPRLFRLPQQNAIINRMGFNNEGVDAMVKRIHRSSFFKTASPDKTANHILGVNIGKNFDTAVEDALQDYLICLRKVYKVASYVAVNISSPNTPGLRDLQQGDELPKLLQGMQEERQKLAEMHGRSVPLLVKIAPDMSDEELRGICDRLIQFGIDGIIVSNTTLDRDQVQGLRHGNEAGGLSGSPVLGKSNHALEVVATEVKGKLVIVGVGGILKGEDAARKVELGADLVQLYTGFIYEGPDLIHAASESILRANK